MADVNVLGYLYTWKSTLAVGQVLRTKSYVVNEKLPSLDIALMTSSIKANKTD